MTLALPATDLSLSPLLLEDELLISEILVLTPWCMILCCLLLNFTSFSTIHFLRSLHVSDTSLGMIWLVSEAWDLSACKRIQLFSVPSSSWGMSSACRESSYIWQSVCSFRCRPTEQTDLTAFFPPLVSMIWVHTGFSNLHSMSLVPV